MKRITLLSLCLLCVCASQAQKLYQTYLDYIDRYASTAVDEQRKYGIPASITLAQGLLESQAGQSELARAANNHFGIKCHKDWTGGTYYQDDDAKDECFRVYTDVAMSFEDHSKFLYERQRYADLFELEPTDYRGWAEGLKADGYATDPNYAPKLIKLIEDYDLQRFDLSGVTASADVPTASVLPGKSSSSGTGASARTSGGRTARQSGGSTRESNQKTLKNNTSTTAVKTSASRTASASTSQTASHAAGRTAARQVVRNNGVRCLLANRGDTYGSIASSMGYRLQNILKFNDVDEDRELREGEYVYLGSKRPNASKSSPKVIIVKEGDTAYDISQQYGISVQSLYDLNGMDYAEGVRFGQRLVLRKK